MPLIKEDGSGLNNANSYADVTDADAYHDGHLYASAWLAASGADKEKALIMATRLLDAECRFNGFRTHETQSLQWPRERCPDPDRLPNVGCPRLSVLHAWAPAWLPNNLVPKPVMDATCEMAREVLISDRTAAPPGEGIDIITTGAGATYSSIKYSKSDTPRIITRMAEAMLSKYGSLFEGRFAAVKLVRT